MIAFSDSLHQFHASEFLPFLHQHFKHSHGLTECLPLGKRIYESDMTYPVISVDNDMKGWAAKFEITRGKTGIRYRIYPSEYSDRDIDFTVPLSYFGKRN